MSEGMILRRGGGGGGAYGMIVVNYPAGSTLTITGGKASKKDISSTMRIYYVKTAGTYTITATRSGKSASRQVVISAWGQSATITLNYELILYSYGTIETTISGGLTKYDNNSAPVNFNDTNITMGGSTAAAKCSVATENIIDVSSYSSLIVTYSNTSNYPFSFGLVTSRGTTPTYETGAVYSDSNKKDEAVEITLDISDFSGEYYIGFSKSSAGTRTVYEVKMV